MKDDSEQGAWEALLSAQSHTRIVACVNGCKGINPDAIPVMLEALEAFNRQFTKLAGFAGKRDVTSHYSGVITLARAAIAKAKK